jgi:hypothetical protein
MVGDYFLMEPPTKLLAITPQYPHYLIMFTRKIPLYKHHIWRFPKMGGTPKSSILIGCSLINHPAIGVPPF